MTEKRVFILPLNDKRPTDSTFDQLLNDNTLKTYFSHQRAFARDLKNHFLYQRAFAGTLKAHLFYQRVFARDLKNHFLYQRAFVRDLKNRLFSVFVINALLKVATI